MECASGTENENSSLLPPANNDNNNNNNNNNAEGSGTQFSFKRGTRGKTKGPLIGVREEKAPKDDFRLIHIKEEEEIYFVNEIQLTAEGY